MHMSFLSGILRYRWGSVVAIGLLLVSAVCAAQGQDTLLNASYDPTREFYRAYNGLFAAHWKALTGRGVTVYQSHGGSGKQARSVIDGLAADVVTLALGSDIQAIEKAGLVRPGWEKALPFGSAPYTSTIVFLVRRGNPKHIRDWIDLARPGVQVITPNPRTSGGARWNYLAAWGYALKKSNGNQVYARSFTRRIYANAPILDTGARGAVTTFAQRGMGDVLVTWENEAHLAIEKLGRGRFEIVMPSVSILAEPTVAVVDRVVDRRNTRRLAEEYLLYLYSDEAQALATKHYFRPRRTLPGNRAFAHIALFTVQEMFGGWQKAQKTHFADNGVFNSFYKAGR